ncbi:MAG: alpha/beta fold hydrolase [Woeseiaceae bacterium]
MLHRKLLALLPIIGISLLTACNKAPPVVDASYEFESVDAFVSSRDIDIPVTFIRPLTDSDETFPLVVIAHGHGGSRHESGAYIQLAESLATQGIASIRMDFPGCGDSSESFANNNLSNMLDDIRASQVFALSQPQIDSSRVGLHGWSMGARLVLTLSTEYDYKAITTWAPSAHAGADSMLDFFGGTAAYEQMKATAILDGFAPFTTIWGQDQKLGPGFFSDLEQSVPLDIVSEYEGALLVLYGEFDKVVLPEEAEAVIAAARKSSDVVGYMVRGANHGFGVFSDEPHLTRETIDTTVDFLQQKL